MMRVLIFLLIALIVALSEQRQISFGQSASVNAKPKFEGVAQRRARLLRNRASSSGVRKRKPRTKTNSKRSWRSSKSKHVQFEGVDRRRQRLLQNRSKPKSTNKSAQIEGVKKRRERLLTQRAQKSAPRQKPQSPKPKFEFEGIKKRRERLLQARSKSAQKSSPASTAAPIEGVKKRRERLLAQRAQKSAPRQKSPVRIDGAAGFSYSDSDAPTEAPQPVQEIVVKAVDTPASESSQEVVVQPVTESAAVESSSVPVVVVVPTSPSETAVGVVDVTEKPTGEVIGVTVVTEAPVEGVEKRRERLPEARTDATDAIVVSVVASNPAEETPQVTFEGVQQRAERLSAARTTTNIPIVENTDVASKIRQFKAQQEGEVQSVVVVSPTQANAQVGVSVVGATPAVTLEGVENRRERLTEARTATQAQATVAPEVIGVSVVSETPLPTVEGVENRRERLLDARSTAAVEEIGEKHEKSPRREIAVEQVTSQEPVISNVVVSAVEQNAQVGVQNGETALAVSTAAPGAAIGVVDVSANQDFNQQESIAPRLESPEYSIDTHKPTQSVQEVVVETQSAELQPAAVVEVKPLESGEPVKSQETEATGAQSVSASKAEQSAEYSLSAQRGSGPDTVVLTRESTQPPRAAEQSQEYSLPSSSQTKSAKSHQESNEYSQPPIVQQVNAASGSDLKALVESLTKPSLKERIERTGGKVRRIIEDVQVIIVKDPPLPQIDDEPSNTSSENQNDKQLREYLQQQLLSETKK
jgi:hypothetical protein